MTNAAEGVDPTDHLPEDVESVRAALVEWYEADHREYPWRETTDPYAILVSEVMRDRKSTRLNSSHIQKSRMPSSA